MSKLKSFFNFLLELFGFKRNSKYVKAYLNEANIKSSIYMSSIIIVLEIWMIIRQIREYIIPGIDNFQAPYTSNLDFIFGFMSFYVLFIVCSIAIIIFAITFLKKSNSKALFIANIIIASICILWPFLLFAEHIVGTEINRITTILLYASMPLLGASILAHTIYRRKYRVNNTVLSMIIIICFALVCLLFGIKVGYSDFISKSRPKMITCFLTMIIFVACLLIWKPYISILILSGVFMLFYYFLDTYPNREFLDGDKINYITFLISLTMIAISIYQQRVAEAKKDELLIYEANHDHLTNITNVKFITSTVKVYYDNKDKIFLFLNLTNFRAINEHRGFDGGNEFLINFAKKIEETFSKDLIARQSDDHFVVYTSINTYEEKINRLDEIVKELADGLFVLLKVGGYKPKKDEDPNRAIDKARYACGIIKHEYGVLYREYDDEMDEAFNKRQYIINHIDEAIEKGWIVAYYQPVVWSKNHELCGAEALARWIDPTHGFLSPADFIPVLENTRLIHKLDKAIINYVCKNLRESLDSDRPIVPVSLNFSRLDFELMDVKKELEDAILKYNIDRNYIHVEITESALSSNVETLSKTVASLKNDGYAIWLDDFGSGYSSLNVLKDFVFDVIKIDMKFLSNFEHNDKTKDIIDCIIQLATKLGMKTLTEGVETKEQSKFLEDVGCGRLQGYLYGKPFKLAEFEEKIENGTFKISKKIL